MSIFSPLLKRASRGSVSAKRKRAEKQYVALVREISEVVELRLADEDEGPVLWTIISAIPFDDGPRDRVIEAQIETMRGMQLPLMGFRLINREELSDGFRDEYISGIGMAIWSR